MTPSRTRTSAAVVLVVFATSFFLPAADGGGTMYGWEAAEFAFKSTFSRWTVDAFADELSFALMTVSNFLVPAVLLTLAVPRDGRRILRHLPWVLLVLTLNSARFVGSDGIYIGYYLWLSAQAACTALAMRAKR